MGAAPLRTGPPAPLPGLLELRTRGTMELRRALGCFRGADIQGDFSWVCCTFREPTAELQSCRESGGSEQGARAREPWLRKG